MFRQKSQFFVNDIQPMRKWPIVVIGVIILIGLVPIALFFFGSPK